MPPNSLTKAGPSATGVVECTTASALPVDSVFAAVVERHSAMVLGVCRRMLKDADADDAAQAVFILFWQKSMCHEHESNIAGWLHRTTQHVCRNARRSKDTRFRHEQRAAAESAMTSSDAADPVRWREIRQILDEEVDRLPEKIRIAFVLFHFENRPLAEVADLLDSTVPTVGTWLQRARQNLAVRLNRRGIVVGGMTLGAILSQNLVAEAVPTAFVAATVQSVSEFSAVGVGVCPPLVASLVKAGAVGGLSKSVWITLTLLTAAIGIPIVAVWSWPGLQTRYSTHFPLLQGDWREVSNEQNGGPVNATPPVEQLGTLQISGRNFRRSQTLADGRKLEGESGSFVLDSSSRPAAINFQTSKGTAYGVYELDGDTLTVCVTRSGGARPSELSTTKNDDRILSRYRRVR